MSQAMKKWHGFAKPLMKTAITKQMKLYISKLNPKSNAFFQYQKKQWNYDDEVWYDARQRYGHCDHLVINNGIQNRHMITVVSRVWHTTTRSLPLHNDNTAVKFCLEV